MNLDNFQPGKKLEKFETTKANLYVMGALSKFKGFGDIIASYYDKEKINGTEELKMIRKLLEWDKQIIENEKSLISSGFIEQKDGSIFFGENTPKYTQFPEQNRFYRQAVYSWIDNSDPDYINAGKIFSAMKPFKQYSEQSSGQEPMEVLYEKEGLQTPEKLKEILDQILGKNKLEKLFIKAYPETNDLVYAEKVLEYLPVRTVMNAFDTLSAEQRQDFSLFFGDPHSWGGLSNDKKITILLKEMDKSYEDYYLSKGNIFINWKDIIN